MAVWNKWYRFKRRRNARLDKKSTAKPEVVSSPSIMDGGNGLLLAVRGEWSNYPTVWKLVWKVNGEVREYGDSFCYTGDSTGVSLEVTASNDNGSTTVVVP